MRAPTPIPATGTAPATTTRHDRRRTSRSARALFVRVLWRLLVLVPFLLPRARAEPTRAELAAFRHSGQTPEPIYLTFHLPCPPRHRLGRSQPESGRRRRPPSSSAPKSPPFSSSSPPRPPSVRLNPSVSSPATPSSSSNPSPSDSGATAAGVPPRRRVHPAHRRRTPRGCPARARAAPPRAPRPPGFLERRAAAGGTPRAAAIPALVSRRRPACASAPPHARPAAARSSWPRPAPLRRRPDPAGGETRRRRGAAHGRGHGHGTHAQAGKTEEPGWASHLHVGPSRQPSFLGYVFHFHLFISGEHFKKI